MRFGWPAGADGARLRKLGLTLLADALCTNEQIKAFGGHKSDRALAPYLRSANQQVLARQAWRRCCA